MKEERPKIKIELTVSDRIIEIAGWLALLVLWMLTISNYSNLPETIPTHFNGMGVADGFGSKRVILGLPIISTVLFLGLTILNRFPHIFNYPTAINKENASVQYAMVTKLIRTLKLAMVVIFGFITFQIIQNAAGAADGLGVWFLPASLVLIFIPLIVYFVKSRKMKL